MSIKDQFIDGAAYAFWADLYMTEVEELYETHYELYSELSPGPGGDWGSVIPETPVEAMRDGEAFELELRRANNVDSIAKLYQAAVEADGGRKPHNDDAWDFGYYTAMEALGHGISWFDSHAKFPLRIPLYEPSVGTRNALYDFIEDRKEGYEENPSEHPVILIEYGVEEGDRGWAPVVWHNGRKKGGYSARYDRDEAMNLAEREAQDEAAHYTGDWDVRVVQKNPSNTTRSETILGRFYSDTIDASELRGIDPDVIRHAMNMGWVTARGRKISLTALGREEKARQGARSNPPRKRKARARNVEVHTWFERDRAHVEVRDADTEDTIVEWWDEDVQQAVEDGFLDPRDWEGSAISYAKDIGLLPKSNPNYARPSTKKMTRQEAHDYLLSMGYKPVPGSSRYEDRHMYTGRIVPAGGRGDSWYVELEDDEDADYESYDE